MKISKMLIGHNNYRLINEKILYEEGMSLVGERYKEVETDISFSHRYKGNFIGLLIAMNIPPSKHILVMQANNITSSFDYDGITTVLKVPIDDDRPF